MPVTGIISQPAWGSIAADAITAGTIATDAIGAAELATDAIGSAELATSAVEEIVGVVANTGGTATVAGVLGDPKGSTMAELLANLGARFVGKGITYDGSVSYAAFTVTGTVAVRVVGTVTSALTNHADTTSVGTATSPAGLIAATAGTAMQTIGQIWVDNAPSELETYPTSWVMIEEDIIVTSTANIVGGTVMLNLWWFPIANSGGDVTTNAAVAVTNSAALVTAA